MEPKEMIVKTPQVVESGLASKTKEILQGMKSKPQDYKTVGGIRG